MHINEQTMPMSRRGFLHLLAVAGAVALCGNVGTAHAAKHGNRALPPGIYVRIIPMGHFAEKWDPKHGHSGRDVLKMIEELKPTCLNRFMCGMPHPELMIPMGNGEDPMPFPEYLTAAMKAGAPGCTIAPKLHLNDRWVFTDEYRMKAARALRNLKVTPRLTVLDLDCYFSKGNAAERKQVLQDFKDMGWKDLEFNFVGNTGKTFGLVSYGMAGIDGNTGFLGGSALGRMRKTPGVRVYLGHIDYPPGIAKFASHSPDKQAAILTHIQKIQYEHGFRFIYPVLCPYYDSTKVRTSKGKTIYEVIKGLIEKDRKAAAASRSGKR
jgi:hypothetical protein